MRKEERARREDEARQALRSFGVEKGKTIYTSLKHVSRSGMMRHVSPYIIKDGEPINISYQVSIILGWPGAPDGGAVKVSGAGMDMGFHLVHSLSYALFNDGYALKQRWM